MALLLTSIYPTINLSVTNLDFHRYRFSGILSAPLVHGTGNPLSVEFHHPSEFCKPVQEFGYERLYLLLNRVLTSDHAQHGAGKIHVFLSKRIIMEAFCYS